jgi:hypothetical protein
MKPLPASAIVAVAFGALCLCLLVFLPESDHPLIGVPFTISFISLLWYLNDAQRRRHASRRREFLEEQCVPCGYDLRGQADRCPECGARVWRPDQPLAWPERLWPDMPARVLLSVDPHEFVDWMLERRAPTPGDAWGPDPLRRRVASIVTRICLLGANDDAATRFVPGDPFDVVSGRIMIDTFAMAMRRYAGVSLTLEELVRFERMTLGEVVEAIASRAPRETPT